MKLEEPQFLALWRSIIVQGYPEKVKRFFNFFAEMERKRKGLDYVQILSRFLANVASPIPLTNTSSSTDLNGPCALR